MDINLRQTCGHRGCYCIWCRPDSIIKPLPGQPAVIHICDDECNPGNCETAHREDAGWDAVESGERFAAEMGHLR